MRGYIFRFLLLFVAVLLQYTVLDRLKILEARLDLTIILTLYFGFKGGIMAGQTTGFMAGLLEDLIPIKNFGINMLIKTVIGFVSGLFHKRIYTDVFLTIFLITLGGSLLKGVLYMLVVQIFIKSMSFAMIKAYFVNTLLIEMLLNAFVAPLIFNLLNKLNLSLGEDSF